MKLRLWVSGIGLLVLGLLFSLSQWSMGQAPEPAQTEKTCILYEPDVKDWIPDSKVQLKSIITQMQTMMDAIPSQGPLSAGIIGQIGDIYGQNGNLTGHDGWTLRGKREIVLYLSSLLACHKVSDFRMEIKSIYAKEFTDTFKNLKRNPGDVAHSVYFILCNSYVLDGQLIKVPGSITRRHQADCTNSPDN